MSLDNIRKKLHASGSSAVQEVAYSYNERGWTTSINNPSSVTDRRRFGMNLHYAGNPQAYNGNIGSVQWNTKISSSQTQTQTPLQAYTYTYDRLNRLKKAAYSGATNKAGHYNEELADDVMGNIGTLRRTNGGMVWYNHFKYSYTGNKLNSVSDIGTANRDNSFTYDVNGNAKTNTRLGITDIEYNYLNLPKKFVKGSQQLVYTYDATGRKLKKTLGSAVTDYVDGIQYKNGVLEFIKTEEGRILPNGSSFVYEYFLKDHLGNTRAIVDHTGAVKQIQDYYAFGMEMNTGAGLNAASNHYKYNGKEKQVELGLDQLDYGARFYDAEIGRWNVVDPLAEKHFNLTPYNYVLNNPLIYIDPFGLDTLLYNLDSGKLLDRRSGEGKSPIYTVSGEYDDGDMWNNASPLTYQIGRRGGGISGKSFRKNHPLKGEGTKFGAQVYLEDLMDMTKEFNSLISDNIEKFEGLAKLSDSWGYISPKFLVFKGWVTDDGSFDLKSLKRPIEKSYAAIVIGEWSIHNGELRRYDDYGNIGYGAWGRAAGFSSYDLIKGSNLNQIWKGWFGRTALGGDEVRDVNMIKKGIRGFK